MSSVDRLAVPDVAVSLRGIVKSWHAQPVLHGIDLDIGRGEFVALLGPSGCGKTTLLRIVAGLEQPDGGTVAIDGRDMRDVPPDGRKLSMVFQSYALFPHLSVAENIAFGLRVRGVSRDERNRRVREALATTGLVGLEARKPAALSGGQRQRVALARAIVAGHSLCLMDEPLSNLDAKLRNAVRLEIRELQQRLGLTVLYVTHDQTEAMGMADRIVLMQSGRIEQVGTPESIYREPANTFVAGFVGMPPMVLIPEAHVPLALHQPAGEQGPLLYGVRPEDFELVPPSSNSLRATVLRIEFQGADSYVYVETEQHLRFVACVSARGRDMSLREGCVIGLSWRPQSQHLFDQHSGRKLAETTCASLEPAARPLHRSLAIVRPGT